MSAMSNRLEQQFPKLKRLPPYLFAEVNAMKAVVRAEGEDIIDFGMGNPDQPTPPHIVEKLREAALNPRAHRYSTSRGIPGLRRAIIAGASLRHMPVADGYDFMSELKRAVQHSVPKPVGLIVCFPSNPTAKVVGLDFYAEVIDFCRYHGIWVISDLAYAELYYDNVPPPSILEVPGAKDIAVEFTSLSKTYSMPGWRIGFCCGNPLLIEALGRVKSYLDYGAYTPIQVAATAALNGPQECVAEIRQMYKERRDTLVEAFAHAGWDVPPPPASMFCWGPLPKRFANMGSMNFAKLALTEAKVAVSPGVGFGEYGEGYVRLGLVENRHRIRQAARNLKTFLASDPEQYMPQAAE